MPKYAKAYAIDAMRDFEGWREPDASGEPEPEGNVVFLSEDLVVRADVFEDAPEIFSDPSPAWRSFCETSLGFRVPDWELESAEVRERVRAQGSMELDERGDPGSPES